MNDQLQKALTELANKLGTTVQYLWAVLVKQGRVEGAKDLCYCAFVVISAVCLLIVHLRLSKEKKDERGRIETKYSENEALEPIMWILLIVWFIGFIIALFAISEMWDVYMNPEYWALHKILSN